MEKGEPSPFRQVGLLEVNPHKIVIRLRDTTDRYLIMKDEFRLLMQGRKTEIPVVSRDMTQTVLQGEVPEGYAGTAEITKSGKAVRISLKNGRTLFLSLSNTLDVLERRSWSCGVSEVVN